MIVEGGIRRRNNRIWYLILGVFAATFLFTFLNKQFTYESEAEAASLANFDPGYIISDWQMGNYNSMTETEIQDFLWKKGKCYNTSFSAVGTRVDYFSDSTPPTTWHVKDGHTVCLAEEDMNGETAAHIIWQTAQDYKINPQVLIVLLQKETGLITDPIPNSWDYQRAAGYGCPDTAACSSKYYGFKNQVRNAAALFRTVLDGGWTNYPLGENYVQYNPNAACGGSMVNIRSLATSALYRYTPYQPNAGALAAGYGTASCGAYGNRNFYLYFQDWFGGITEFEAEWQQMQAPRVMTVNKSTAIIDVKKQTLTNDWLMEGENYYFTKKTTVFLGSEKQVCLQRRSDEETDRCVLMNRLSEFSPSGINVDLPRDNQDYVIQQQTCIVNMARQDAECEKKMYPVGEIINVGRVLKIDNIDYLAINDENAVIKARAKLKPVYESIGPVLMKIGTNSYKYAADGMSMVQNLDAMSNNVISIMDKTTINGEVFYRTVHDHTKGFDYLIPSTNLSDNIFVSFLKPRNLEFVNSIESINLNNGEKCKNYPKKTIRRFVNKITYNGANYFQNEEEVGTNCVVDVDSLRETDYNFQEEDAATGFMGFLFPRALKNNNETYMINIKNGQTCEVFLEKGTVLRYTTKIKIKGTIFYRTEEYSKNGSPCSVPALNLLEIN